MGIKPEKQQEISKKIAEMLNKEMGNTKFICLVAYNDQHPMPQGHVRMEGNAILAHNVLPHIDNYTRIDFLLEVLDEGVSTSKKSLKLNRDEGKPVKVYEEKTQGHAYG